MTVMFHTIHRAARRLLPLAVAVTALTWLVAAPLRPPKIPAHISVTVTPESVDPGGKTQVTLRLDPIEGVKINRYPKIKLQVPGHPGLVQEAEVTVGNSAPPPPGDTASNYFSVMDPLTLELSVEHSAKHGKHEIDGKLTYYYCIPASGFCAPHRVPVKIPVTVR